MLPRLLFQAIRSIVKSSVVEPPQLSTVRLVVMVELSRLGDVVHILPAVQQFKLHFPSVSIHCVIREKFASLLRLCDLDMEIHAVADARISHLLPAIRGVRRTAPDLACSMSPSRSNALVTLLSGATIKAGYLDYSNSLTPFLGAHKVELFGRNASSMIYERENIARRSEKVLQVLGIPLQGKISTLPLKKRQHEKLVSLLKEQGALPPGRYVVVHPFSGWEYRSWQLDNYVALANRASGELGLTVLVACEGRNRSQLKEAFVTRSPGVQLFSTDSAAELAVALKDASLFVGNDSGPLHLAAILGVPSVGIFGPASPALTGPSRGVVEYLYRPVPCAPCDQRRCIRPQDPCMHQYSVNEVLTCMEKTLKLAVTHDAVAHA